MAGLPDAALASSLLWPTILLDLQDLNEGVRKSAIVILQGASGAELTPLASELVPPLTHYDPDVREAALDALSRVAPDELAKHARAVVGLIEDRQVRVRDAALRALASLPPGPFARLVPKLTELIEHGDWHVRPAAEAALRTFLPRATQYPDTGGGGSTQLTTASAARGSPSAISRSQVALATSLREDGSVRVPVASLRQKSEVQDQTVRRALFLSPERAEESSVREPDAEDDEANARTRELNAQLAAHARTKAAVQAELAVKSWSDHWELGRYHSQLRTKTVKKQSAADAHFQSAAAIKEAASREVASKAEEGIDAPVDSRAEQQQQTWHDGWRDVNMQQLLGVMSTYVGHVSQQVAAVEVSSLISHRATELSQLSQHAVGSVSDGLSSLFADPSEMDPSAADEERGRLTMPVMAAAPKQRAEEAGTATLPRLHALTAWLFADPSNTPPEDDNREAQRTTAQQSTLQLQAPKALEA